jgi:hypothetical protein
MSSLQQTCQDHWLLYHRLWRVLPG